MAGAERVTGAKWWRGVGVLGVALVVAAAALLVLDWVLFGMAGLADHLRVEDLASARGKLLIAPRYRDSRVLYLGDSRALTAFDPLVVSAACQCGPGYNAAFGAADPTLTRIIAVRLLEVLSPRVVIIGVSQWWLSDGFEPVFGPARDLLPPWEVARLPRVPDTGEMLSSAVAAAWRLYRYRTELRSTLGLGLPSTPVEHRRGYLPRPYESRSGATLGRDAIALKELGFVHFSVTGRRSAALRNLLGDLDRSRIAVILVAPPLHPVARGLVPVELDQFHHALARLAAESHAGLEDLTAPDWITPGDFSDTVHLNESGAEKVSRYIGLRLRSAPPAPGHALQ